MRTLRWVGFTHTIGHAGAGGAYVRVEREGIACFAHRLAATPANPGAHGSIRRGLGRARRFAVWRRATPQLSKPRPNPPPARQAQPPPPAPIVPPSSPARSARSLPTDDARTLFMLSSPFSHLSGP